MAINPKLQALTSKTKAKYSNNNGDVAKLKDGRNVIRIIAPSMEDAPWVGETGQWWADQGVYWIKPSENAKPIAVVGDSDIVYGESSPVGLAIEHALSAPGLSETDKKLYASWKARHSVLINAVIRDSGSDDPQVLELTKSTFGQVLDIWSLFAAEGIDITDPLSGTDIIITRTGKGLNTEYTVATAPVSKPIDKGVLKKTTDLPKFIEQKWFRGEERKAVNAISQISGMSLPSNLLPSTASTASAAMSMPGMSAPAIPAIPAIPSTPAYASPAASVETVSDATSELEKAKALLAKRTAELEAAKAADAAAELAELESLEAANEDTAKEDEDELSKVLAELESLKAS